MEKELKLKFGKLIERELHQLEEEIDVNECVNLFLKILEYKVHQKIGDFSAASNNVTQVIDAFFTKQKTDQGQLTALLKTFATEFESFIKKISHLLLDKGQCNDKYEGVLYKKDIPMLGSYLESLNYLKYIYLDEKDEEVTEIILAAKNENDEPIHKLNVNDEKTFERLYSKKLKSFDSFYDFENKKLDIPKISEKFGYDFESYLIKAYHYKNIASHQSSFDSITEMTDKFKDIAISMIYIVYFLQTKIEAALNQILIKNNEDLTDYIIETIDRLENKEKQHVDLHYNELSKDSDRIQGDLNYIFENADRSFRIIANGGSGKTASLEKLTVTLAKKWLKSPQTSIIPVLISMANVPVGISLIDHISSLLNCKAEKTEELISHDKLFLLLDGLNEIVDLQDHSKTIHKEIEEIINKPDSNVRVIVTDRKSVDQIDNNVLGVKTYAIEPLNEHQISKFLKEYTEDAANEIKIQKHFEKFPSLLSSLSKPFYLSRITDIMNNSLEMPKSISDIIDKSITLILERERDEKKETKINIDEFKLALGYVADQIWNKYNTNHGLNSQIVRKKLVDAVNELGFENTQGGYILRIAKHLDILVKDSDKIVSFFHQEYIEYFANYYMRYETETF
ncbi:NACHT domain-containing protein [Crocinitomicaceae bacterium]|nr:NACHT domain-containing protein [Crocinitomicaceae bacterium]